MKFEKLVPNIFYVDINKVIEFFVHCLHFSIIYDEIKSSQPFCVLEKDGLRINLFLKYRLSNEHCPEFRLVTKKYRRSV